MPTNTGPRIPRWPSTSQAPRTWRDPNCANDDMWEPERTSPWLWLVYAVVIVITLAASAIQPWGFAQ